MKNNNFDDMLSKFFTDSDYHGRYSQYWVRRFGMIPTLATSYDNSNDIYDLLAWLQRGFKMLLDDFLSLELEFEEFKNALTEMLEVLIPQLIRQFANSEEFKNLILGIINDWYNTFLKPILDAMRARITKNENDIKSLQNDIKAIRNEIKELRNSIQQIFNTLKQLEQRIKDFENKVEARLEKMSNEVARIGVKLIVQESVIRKILNNLHDGSGVWALPTGGNSIEYGDFKSGLYIAGGNINLFGGEPDGSSYIRTNQGASENDLAGGV